jgi:hydrogenase expression/formation protein HypE
MSGSDRDELSLDCPVEISQATVQLAHGGGGRRMRELIEQMFLPKLGGAALRERHDAAVLTPPRGRLAVTTDGYVVKPMFFPGGDIGQLAVYGTVNDLAMAGARPVYLTVSFILEEGLELAQLERVVTSLGAAAASVGVEIVAGDTKVVDRGSGDGVFLSTTGVGVVPDGIDIRPSRIQSGDVVLINGDLGRHGIAVLSVREGMGFELELESDAAPLHELVSSLISAGVELHCLRDLTRGGLAAALNELALDAGLTLEVEELAVPIGEAVRGACELLGLDPFYVANEGRMIAIVPPDHAARALAVLNAHPRAPEPAQIGRVSARPAAAPGVVVVGPLGTRRRLDLLSGEQLPRIC